MPEESSKTANAVSGRIRVLKSVGRKKNPVETEASDYIEAAVFEAPHATVSCGMGVTVNLGNFESCKVDVHVSLPCYAAEIPEGYSKIRSWVEQIIRREIQNIKKPASAEKPDK